MPHRFFKIINKRLLSFFALILGIFLVSGCAGTHLYNKGNHQLAQNASSAFKDAKINESFDEERVRLSEINERALLVVRQDILAIRDAALVAMIGAETGTVTVNSRPKTQSWIDQIENQFTKHKGNLIGDIDIVKIDSLFKKRSRKKKDLDDAAKTIALSAMSKQKPILNFPTPSCPFKLKKEDIPLELKDNYDDYEDVCEDFEKIEGEIKEILVSGDYKKTLYEISKIEEIKLIIKDDFDKKKGEYVIALDQFNKAVKSNLLNIETKESVDEKLGKLKEKLDGIDILQDLDIKELKRKLEKAEITLARFNDIKKIIVAIESVNKIGNFDRFAVEGRLAKLKEQKDNLEKVIEQISNVEAFQNEDGEFDLSKISEIKASLKTLSKIKSISKIVNPTSIDAISSINDLVAVLREIPLSALILKKEGLRIEMEGLNRQLLNCNKRLGLMHKKKDTIELEINYLAEANKWLNSNEIDSINKLYSRDKESSSLKTFVVSSDPERLETVARFLTSYANAWSIGRLIREEIDWMITGLRHESILDNSEIALAAWENLISVSIDQLVALHGAGITPDDIAKLFNAAGITAIGVGVN